MAENKTQRTKASVAAFLAAIPDPQRQRDAKALAALTRKTTGERPAMWGSSVVGYGQTTYQGSRGRAVDWFPVGFSPRQAALVLYLMAASRPVGIFSRNWVRTRWAADVSISLALLTSIRTSWRASSG